MRRTTLARRLMPEIGAGTAIVSSVYDGMKIEGGRIRIRFRHVGQGLEARGEKLLGFEIAGRDHRFAWADARIEGNMVVVSSTTVPVPLAARYAWADNPACNLFNKDGLLASPFRTDDWPGTTKPIP